MVSPSPARRGAHISRRFASTVSQTRREYTPDLSEHFVDVALNGFHASNELARGPAVDGYDRAAAELWQHCCRIDSQRRSDGQKQVCMASFRFCFIHASNCLAVEDDVRLDHALTVVAMGNLLGENLMFEFVIRVAVSTPSAMPLLKAAVYLDDVPAARFLVQAVDVLGDHRLEQALLLKFGQECMSLCRLDAVDDAQEVSGECEEVMRVRVEPVDVKGLLGVIPVCHVKSVRPSEVWDSRSRRDSCASQRDDVMRLSDEFCQFLCVHHSSLPRYCDIQDGALWPRSLAFVQCSVMATPRSVPETTSLPAGPVRSALPGPDGSCWS